MGGQHDILRVVCSQMVHGPEDDGQHERIKACVGGAKGLITSVLSCIFVYSEYEL